MHALGERFGETVAKRLQQDAAIVVVRLDAGGEGFLLADAGGDGKAADIVGKSRFLRRDEIGERGVGTVATGIAGDGWTVGVSPDPTVSRAAYNRFDVGGGGTGRLLVSLSRETFCPSVDERLPGLARVRIGEIGRGSDKQPAILRETAVAEAYVPVCTLRPIVLPTPDRPWRAEVEIETFVPAEVDPVGSGGERRALGARVSFDLLSD